MPEQFMIDLRGTRAIATDVATSAESSLAWIEGPYLLELYGAEGQALSDLIAKAESLRRAPL